MIEFKNGFQVSEYLERKLSLKETPIKVAVPKNRVLLAIVNQEGISKPPGGAIIMLIKTSRSSAYEERTVR